jgi:hypothetical protein
MIKISYLEGELFTLQISPWQSNVATVIVEQIELTCQGNSPKYFGIFVKIDITQMTFWSFVLCILADFGKFQFVQQ